MNYFNDYTLDELAMRVTGAYLKAGDVPETRVDPVALCEKVLSLKVKHERLSLNYDVLGVTSFGLATANVIDEDGDMTVYPLDGKTVLIERELLHNPCGCGKYNFTVAHEACHHVLHMIEQGGRGEKNRLLIYSRAQNASVEFEEWQTDRLAAAILMNRPMLFAAMKDAGIPSGIKTLDNDLRNDAWLAFCRTAEILGVSLSALEKRMTKLGLIEKNYYHLRNEKGSILETC